MRIERAAGDGEREQRQAVMRTGRHNQGMLEIEFTKLSPGRHRTSVRRSDGSVEVAEFETRSLLFHDFVHLAVESEAGLSDAFFGRLSRGLSFAQLAEPVADLGRPDELMETERVVGPLQSACRRGVAPCTFVASLRSYLSAVESPIPDWLSEDLVRRAMARLRQLDGEWAKLRIGETLKVEFPPGF